MCFRVIILIFLVGTVDLFSGKGGILILLGVHRSFIGVLGSFNFEVSVVTGYCSILWLAPEWFINRARV